MTKVSDYILEFLVEKGVNDIFTVSGGGAFELDLALGRKKEKGEINYICNHHEQASSMATEAYSRINGFGACIVTSGPGPTNALSGVAGAFLDSTPMMIISGQVGSKYLIGNSGLRQRGVQEINPIPIYKSITKYAERVEKSEDIKYHLDRAFYLALEGRPGPVLLDIPLDVQSAEVEVNKLRNYIPTFEIDLKLNEIEKTKELIYESDRPILYIGQGVRLSNGLKDLETLLEKVKIPIISSWNAADIIPENHPLYIGRAGMFGQRAANIILQNSDLFLSIGARLTISQTGYNFSAFCRNAKKIIVDIDKPELEKYDKVGIDTELLIQMDAGEFLFELNKKIEVNEWVEWLEYCNKVKNKYPNVLDRQKNEKNFVNSYAFIDKLSDLMPDDSVITTDMGTSFTGTYQSIKLKKGQRMNTSSGLAAMGWGLPGAIGSCVASKKPTFCITGEGGLQMNIQEFQTIVHNNLPIKIFVINNNQYHTIVEAHDRKKNYPYMGCNKESGVSFPDLIKVANSYNIPTFTINNHEEMNSNLEGLVNYNGFLLCDVKMDSNQALEPRMVSKQIGDKKMVPGLEDMAPFLSDEDLKAVMISEISEIKERE